MSWSGRVIDGKYAVGESLGRGGVGDVYVAQHIALHTRVAIKVLRPDVMHADEEAERLVREATTCANIVSDHVVRVHDLGRLPTGEIYLVMEYLEGETLAARLARQGRLALDAVADLALQTLAALEATHAAGVVHRDVKPQNILFARRHEGERVTLVDFGICKRGESNEHLTLPGLIVGTPAYMAPEQVRCEPLDGRCDLYALGVVLHEAASGRLPYVARTAPQLMAEIALRQPTLRLSSELETGLAAIVTRALADLPEDRYADATAMRDDVLAWYASDAVEPSANAISRITRKVPKSDVGAA